MVASDYLARAAVNRLWAHFLGYGFTKPIDDMGPHNPPVYPELLDHLAGQLGLASSTCSSSSNGSYSANPRSVQPRSDAK